MISSFISSWHIIGGSWLSLFSDILTNNCKEGLDEIDWFCWS